MPDIGDVSVKPSSGEPDYARSVGPIITAVVTLIVIIGVAAYRFFAPDTETEEETPSVERILEAPPLQLNTPSETVEPEPVELPILSDSDSFIRGLVVGLSTHPSLSAWLFNEDLIRRFVVTVDNIANGQNPSQHISFMRPTDRFSVRGAEPNRRIDPHSYHRYDTHTQIINSLNAEGVSEIFVLLEPLMGEAYVELGYPETPFKRTLERAIIHLLKVPTVDAPPAVELRATYYDYTNESLGDLTPVQKQFLGMGPDNIRAVKTKLRDIATAIGLQSDR